MVREETSEGEGKRVQGRACRQASRESEGEGKGV